MTVKYNEGIGPLPITSNITIMDNDHSNLAQFTVMITNSLDKPNDILNINISEDVNITSSYSPEEGLLTLNANVNLEDYKMVLRTLMY